MTVNERIKALRKSLSISQDEFAKRLGVTRGVITNIEFGKTVPKEQFLDLICREFNVSETWLRTGEGDMLLRLSRNQEIAEFLGSVMHDPDDSVRKRFISICSRLSVEEWRLLSEIAKKMSQGE